MAYHCWVALFSEWDLLFFRAQFQKNWLSTSQKHTREFKFSTFLNIRDKVFFFKKGWISRSPLLSLLTCSQQMQKYNFPYEQSKNMKLLYPSALQTAYCPQCRFFQLYKSMISNVNMYFAFANNLAVLCTLDNLVPFSDVWKICHLEYSCINLKLVQ